MYVSNVYGKSYATSTSTIGTAVIWEKSLENGRTSALSPALLITVAWQPATAMLSWESKWVEVISSSLSSTEFVVDQITLILAHKCRFWTTLSSPLADDPGQWGDRSGVQTVVFLLLDAIAENLDPNLSIMAETAASAAVFSSASVALAADAAPTSVGLTCLSAEL